MKIKKWLVGTGMAALLSGMIFTSLPSADAIAASGPRGGGGAGAGAGKGINAQSSNWCGGIGMQQGTCTGMGMQGARRGGGVCAGTGMGRAIGGMSTNVAEFLGISVTDLRTARQSGKSLAQIAVDKGKTEQELVDYIVGQRTAQLEQLVTDGKITQAQADLCKQNMEDRVKANVERTSVGRPVR